MKAGSVSRNYSKEYYKYNKKWRLAHTAERNAQRNRYYQQYQTDNYMEGRRWSIEDVDMLLISNLCDVALHFLLGRSVQAIQIKRCWILKISLAGEVNLLKIAFSVFHKMGARDEEVTICYAQAGRRYARI